MRTGRLAIVWLGTLSLPGCLFGGGVELRPESAVIRVEDLANRGSPVILDLVAVYDSAFLTSVVDTMTADGWSRFGAGHVARNPASVQAKHLEIPPGDPAVTVSPWFDRDGGVALRLFARYRADEFVAQLDRLRRILIVFTDDGVKVCGARTGAGQSTLCSEER